MESMAWDNLIFERESLARRADREQVRDWAYSKSIFISSVIDGLAEERRVAKTAIEHIGAHPVMWEDITPKHEKSQQAYLEGVRKSDIYVAILSKRYGSKLDSGYSATEEEYEEARKYRKQILIFEDASVPRKERDGNLNRWINDLYKFHSLGKYENPENLRQKIEDRLLDIASEDVALWVKLGTIIFPAISIRESNGGKTTTIVANVRNPRVIAALDSLVTNQKWPQIIRLTYGMRSFETIVKDVMITSKYAGQSVRRIICEKPASIDDYHRSARHSIIGMGGSVNTGTHVYQSKDLVELWIRSTILDEKVDPQVVSFLSLPDHSLKTILRPYQNDTKLAVILARLYIVETLLDEGVVSQVLNLEVGKLEKDAVPIHLLILPFQYYTNVQPEPIEVQGTLSILP